MNEHTEEDAVRLIEAERKKQLAMGWSPDHDDTHYNGELAMAAAVYATVPDKRRYDWKEGSMPVDWPFRNGFSPSPDRLRDLVRAAAMLQAEVARELRYQAANPSNPQPVTGTFFIVNDTDRPYEDLIAEARDGLLHYVHPKFPADRGGMDARWAIPLEDFGVDCVLIDGWLYGKAVRPSVVEYQGNPGRIREWQGSKSFAFPFPFPDRDVKEGGQ